MRLWWTVEPEYWCNQYASITTDDTSPQRRGRNMAFITELFDGDMINADGIGSD